MIKVQLPMVRFLTLLVAVASCISVTGCSDSSDRPDLGYVSGVVTLDGKPLSSASVSFIQTGFRPSIGNTDSDGRYELIYLRDIKGAPVGKHVVKIKRFPLNNEPIKQLPRKYNSDSQLTRDVVSGDNEFNFDLASTP
jgi:hypothetical protein